MKYWQINAYDCDDRCVGTVASYDNEVAARQHLDWLKANSKDWIYDLRIDECYVPVLHTTFTPPY